MNKYVTFLAAILLTVFFALIFSSSWNESAIFDETAHIGAAYSYVTLKDMRLNPEHPPLMKDLAGISMLLIPNLSFPTNTEAWQRQINGQWDQGGNFLFSFGNDAQKILHYARFPIILLALILGAMLFIWVRGLYGNATALLTLLFYTASPTIIAHSRYVTTDIAAAFAFFIGIITFLKFLRRPTSLRLLLCALAFATAQLLKFSLVLLAPLYVIFALVWIWSDEEIWGARYENQKQKIKTLLSQTFSLGSKILAIWALAGLVIWAVYTWHVWNYPLEKQRIDVSAQIGSFKFKPLVTLDTWLIEHKATRPLGQYLFGVMMVTQRTAGGNNAYFLGEVSSKGWWYYFPTAYLLKETLAFHILTLIALLVACWRVLKAKHKSIQSIRGWIHDNFAIFASLFFVGFYWFSSIINPLNIGIRHVLPTFPFIYFLVARQLVLWVRRPTLERPASTREWMVKIYEGIIIPLPKVFIITVLLVWMIISSLSVYPYYLSYFNELAGGTLNGHYYITDSNYDWGQDLIRLAQTTQELYPNQKVYLDYFGGSAPAEGAQRYWLKDRFVPWYSSFGPPPSGSLFAVSANSLRGNRADYSNGSVQPPAPKDRYPWLKEEDFIGRAGTSIFIYKVE